MKVKKNEILEVNHCRKGKFVGITLRAFDTAKEEFYPIAVAQEEPITGIGGGFTGMIGTTVSRTQWRTGEEIPCRNTLCTIKKVKK